jgi:hypothetical protein
VKLEALQADLDAYLGQGPRNSITDRMKFKILTSLTKNHPSIRQIESEIEDLKDNVSHFQKFEKISRHPIQTVAYSIASLNIHQSVEFLESSETLWCGFDGSTKLSKTIQALVLINQHGETHCLDSFESPDGTSAVLANSFGQTFKEIAEAGVKEGIIDESPEIWSKNQISKITMLMSDSCASAQKTKRLLSGVIKDLAQNQEMTIFEGDCSLHLISNGEKKLAKCLSVSTSTVLGLINEVLASDKARV